MKYHVGLYSENYIWEIRMSFLGKKNTMICIKWIVVDLHET